MISKNQESISDSLLMIAAIYLFITVIEWNLLAGTVASWEVNSDQEPFLPLWQATEHDGIVSSLSVYKNGDTVVSGSYDGRVKVWQLDDDVGNCIHTYKGLFVGNDYMLFVDHEWRRQIKMHAMICERIKCLHASLKMFEHITHTTCCSSMCE